MSGVDIETVMAEEQVAQAEHGEETPAAGDVPVKRLGALRLDEYVTLGVEKPKAIVMDFLSRKTVAAIVGEPGIGKSLLLAQLGYCIATGTEFLGMKAQKGASLLIDLEMPKDYMAGSKGRIAQQLQKLPTTAVEMFICNAFDSTVSDPQARLMPDVDDTRKGMKRIGLETFGQRLEAELVALEQSQADGFRERLSTVIIDGVSEFCGGQIEENSAPEVREFVMALRRLAVKFDVAFVILLHTTKETRQRASKTVFRGSSAWRDAVDCMYVSTLHRQEGETVSAKLEAVKVRYGVSGWQKWISRKAVGFWKTIATPDDADQGQKPIGRPNGYAPDKFRAAFSSNPKAILRRKDFLGHEIFKGISKNTFDRWRKTAEQEQVIVKAGEGYRLTDLELERLNRRTSPENPE